MKILTKIWRWIKNDYRCVECDSKILPWRNGLWSCPYHDLTPPTTPDDYLGHYLSDKAKDLYYEHR